MIDPGEFAALNANAHAYYGQPQTRKKTTGRGGTLTSLISEAGGAGGAVAGGAIGTALLPGVGTILGAGIGGLVGSFGGRVAENEVRDGRVGLKDAAIEGLIGGATSAIPVGGLLKGVQKFGGARTLEEAVTQVYEKAGPQQFAPTLKRAGQAVQQNLPSPSNQYGYMVYRGSHQAVDSAAPAHAISDINAIRKQVVQGSHSSNLFSKLQRMQGKPDADIKIYRSAPSDQLNDGDWVTLDRDYAQRMKNETGGKIHTYTVKAKDLRYQQGTDSGNGFNFGYFPTNKH